MTQDVTKQRWLGTVVRIERHDVGPIEGVATFEQIVALFGTVGEDAFRCLRDSFDGEIYGLLGGVGEPWEWVRDSVRWRIERRYDGWFLNMDAFDRPGDQYPYWRKV